MQGIKTPAERAHTVFHRLGVVLAAFPLLGTMWAAIWLVYERINFPDAAYPTSPLWLIGLPAFALAAYLSARTVGWIVAAFFGD